MQGDPSQGVGSRGGLKHRWAGLSGDEARLKGDRERSRGKGKHGSITTIGKEKGEWFPDKKRKGVVSVRKKRK